MKPTPKKDISYAEPGEKAPPKQVLAGLARQERFLETLEKRVAQLESNLTPVLHCAEGAEVKGDANSTPEAGFVPLAASIEKHSERIKLLLNRVEGIIARLEL
jgi:hypothetical protein